MTRFLVVALASAACGGGNPCGRVADLRADCNDPLAEAEIGACRTDLEACNDAQREQIDLYVDCLSEGVEAGECFIGDPKNPTREASGCFGEYLVDVDAACVSAVTQL